MDKKQGISIAVIVSILSLLIAGLTWLFGSGVLKRTVTGIAVETLPSQASYEIGEMLNTSGLVLRVFYDNESYKTISNGFSCSPMKLDIVGTQEITITYSGCTTTFTVKVLPKSTTPYDSTPPASSMVPATSAAPIPSAPETLPVTLSSISIESYPNKTSYVVGEALETYGLRLQASYSNGTTQTISNGFTCSPTNFYSAGIQTISVNYEGKTTSFSVNVSEVAISGISLDSFPDQTSYYLGESLDTSGLRLYVYYNNGTSEIVTNGYSCYPTVLDESGTQDITVTYGYQSTSFQVSVSCPTITLSSYEESISRNCWDESYWDNGRNEPFWIVHLPDTYTSTGSNVTWSIVDGTAYIRDDYIAAQQPGVIVARAAFSYCGYTYTADYYVDFSMYKVTTDINYLYDAPSRHASVLTNVPNRTHVEIFEVAWNASVQASEGRYYIFGHTYYNGYTGWIVIS